MALEYGYGLYEADTTVSNMWTRKFKALSKEDKEYYHKSLPWILMMVDIGCVTRETIPSIKARYKYSHEDLYYAYLECIQKTHPDMGYEEYLQRFLGFQANVASLPRADYIKKTTATLKREVPDIKSKEINELHKALELLVLDEITDEDLPLLVNHQWRSPTSAQKYQDRYSTIAKTTTLPSTHQS